MSQTDPTSIERRCAAMAVLADSATTAIEEALGPMAGPALRLLRAPECGLVMARGRMGGTGAPFNLGEVTVTRCAVTDGSVVGHGYVLGRDPRKAELIARLDALLQRPETADAASRAIAPLEAALAARREREARRAAATRVEFFTLVRGED